MSEKKDLHRKQEEEKTELANKIAQQSRKVAKSYARFEDGLLSMLRSFSSFIDKVLFNKKYSKIVALVLAVLMYLIVNANSLPSLYYAGITSSKSKNDVAITAQYNSDTFELSGLPNNADVTFTGDATSVTTAANADGVILADLTGLTEGTHTVRLKGNGFGDSVDMKIDPSNVTVTLKKKTTQQFDLSYDLVNLDKMEDIYSVGTPEFDYPKVNVRASKDTLNSIAFVKALIDVTGQTADFEQDAKLVAYGSSGQIVKADIVPEKVHVKVPVSSPHKTVAVNVEVKGTVPEGKAISSISMDQQTVTIYGSEQVLSNIDKVTVTLDASTITKDATVLRPITLLTGVSSASISQITMSVKLGEETSRKIDDVKINYRNNKNNYKASQPDNKTTTSVTVYGTEANIKDITPDDITVYVDMADAKPGMQTFPLQIVQPTDGLARYELEEPNYQLNVLGETTDDNMVGGNENND